MRRWIANPWVVFGALALSATLVLLAWFLTPVPSALLIRALFHENAKKTLAVMQPFAPKSGLTQHLNVQYATGGTDTQFDVFTPSAASGPLPTVFWIHGGAWVSGSKENVRPYVQLIAATFPAGYGDVRLTGTFGWASPPADLVEVAEAWAVRSWKARATGDADVLGADEYGNQIISDRFPASWRMTIDSYRVRSVW